MPDENIRFLPRRELLSFEEITRFVASIVPLGIDKVRLTGGEPLVRADLPVLIERLGQIRGLGDLALTTNGLLLADQATALRRAGLRRLNVSLDSLRPDVFEQIARRPGLDRVLEGIAAAQAAGFEEIRLNAVAIRGLTEDDVLPLVEFARQRRLVMRFIEFMPLDAEQQWVADDVLTGKKIRKIIESEYGPLSPRKRIDAARPSTDFDFADRRGGVGLIQPVSEPFCKACDRLRLTADGQLRNCLFSTSEWDARKLLRSGASDEDLQQLVYACADAKRAAHGIGGADFQRPERAMYQIGG